MKKIAYFGGIALMLIFIFTYNFSDRIKQPLPTELISSETEDYKLQREAWIKEMHRAAPDVDWKEIEYQNRLEKRERIQESRKQLSKEGRSLKSITSEEIIPNVLSGTWMEKGSNNMSGRMMTVDVDFEDSLIYAASQGGNIWKSPLDGSNWECLNDYMNMGNVRTVRVFTHNGGKRILVVSSQESFYSDNDGQTWNTATGLEGPQSWGSLLKTAIMADSLQTIYILCLEWDYTNWNSVTSLYNSTDQGESYSQLASFAKDYKYFDIWTSKTSSGDLYMLNGDSLFMHDSAGFNLQSLINSPYPEGDMSEVLMAGHQSANNLVLYALQKVPGESAIFYSENGGQSWVQKTSIPEGPFTSNSFHVSLLDSSKVFFGGMQAYRSYDAATSWTMVNTWGSYYADPDIRLHADIPEIESFIDPSGAEHFYVSTDGGCYHSSDALQTVWNISLDGLHVSQYYSVYSDPDSPSDIFAGSQDQGFQQSLPGSSPIVEFDQVISGDYGHLGSGNDGDVLWCVYPSFAMFVETSSPYLDYYDFVGTNFLWMPPIYPDPDNGYKAYAGGGGSNGGAHIIEIDNTTGSITGTELSFDFSEGNANERISALAISLVLTTNRYVCTTEGDFFYSVNNGTSWTKNSTFEAPDNHYFYGNEITPSNLDPDKVYVAGSGYSNPAVYVSYNHGQNFTAIDNNLPPTLVYGMALTLDDEMLFAATEAGPYVYVDSLGLWFNLTGISAPDQTYWSVEYIPLIKTARFGTHGRGIWDFVIDPTTFIPENQGSIQASVYPNPFVEYITFDADKLKGKRVQLEILSATGQKIYSAQSENFEGKFLWDGNDISGNRVNPGLYFYTIIANGEKVVGKVCKL
ncbi:MAG: T9SS type A sorting domain-containing protein [Bacteroidales bacterium]|nr:T9SS type A sorting domain-containing protein [Bacteroidales bacterium]MCF8455618.1 T9SS type A sorting domain-containing protein [Bacteroidales bacterium]